MTLKIAVKLTPENLWRAIKWSNLCPDGSIRISPQRVAEIDKLFNNKQEGE